MKRRTDKSQGLVPSPRGFVPGDLALGAAIGAICLGASFLAGLKLIGNLYYVEWLAVSAMGFLILVAWLLYLKDDAFLKRIGEKGIEGKPSPRSGRRARGVLFSASAFLFLSSLILYFVFGAGARP